MSNITQRNDSSSPQATDEQRLALVAHLSDSDLKRLYPYTTQDTAEGRTFEFRVEWECDVSPLIASIHWATEKWWRSIRSDHGGVDVKLTLKPNTLTLDEIRWLFSQIVDCHVAMQTLALSSEYTGERRYLDAFELCAKVPGDAALNSAKAGLISLVASLKESMRRPKDAVSAISRGAEGWMQQYQAKCSPTVEQILAALEAHRIASRHCRKFNAKLAADRVAGKNTFVRGQSRWSEPPSTSP